MAGRGDSRRLDPGRPLAKVKALPITGVITFVKIISLLTDPTAHGGRPEDAFHVVAPSLPGHGFSDKPTETGWGIPCIANAWITLMRRLGYRRWVAQGEDWGSVVTTAIGASLAALNIKFFLPYKGKTANPIMGILGMAKEHSSGSSKASLILRRFIGHSWLKPMPKSRNSTKHRWLRVRKDNISPRPRVEYYSGYYAADVFDPDEYSFEVVHKR